MVKEAKLFQKCQDLFNFLNSTIEPWDGPAAICATDAKWVLASSDRNGLRPLRYSITSDNLFLQDQGRDDKNTRGKNY